ncbi:MAG: ABC transporter substrate-binding protein [Actinomycetota bacterium]|nr:ABC transporter substrate-binding protein [Actinomycetota bacterium]
MTALVTPGALTLCCSDMAAPPLFWTEADGARHGYEPDAAQAVAESLELEPVWIFRQWADFARALADGECDGIWCGSAITPERERRFLYTRPYAVFDESVVVRAGDAVAAASDLRGRRVGAIAGSTNMALAKTFEGAHCVPFDGVTDDVFGDMLRALQIDELDAVVDDDVAFLGIERTYPDLRVAFTVATRNSWGCALRLENEELKSQLDDAIARADLPAVWHHWLPTLAYPL